MSRLSEHAERILVRLRGASNRNAGKDILVEAKEEHVRARDVQQFPIAVEQKDTLQIQVKAPPQITPEEKRVPVLRSESKTSPSPKDWTRIGKSFYIKGEVAANEDLTVEGRIVGKIEVTDHQLVIRPGAIVHAEIQAKNVSVEGKVVGNISADDMVAIQSTGSLVGGISAARISINEGSHFKGTVDIISAKGQSAKG
jgi:cytoskeletal protein CcmA (bactofilin family)